MHLLAKNMAAKHVHAICIRNQKNTLRFFRKDNSLYIILCDGVNHCRLMINGWLIKCLNSAISLYIKYNTYNNTAIAAIHKERIDDINVKKLTADFISRSSQRKHYFAFGKPL